jgi:hypothetical protein
MSTRPQDLDPERIDRWSGTEEDVVVGAEALDDPLPAGWEHEPDEAPES